MRQARGSLNSGGTEQVKPRRDLAIEERRIDDSGYYQVRRRVRYRHISMQLPVTGVRSPTANTHALDRRP
jgi:hypothetical protein